MGASKFDTGKPLLATWPRAMWLVGKVSALGKAKYKDDMNYMTGETLGTQRTAEAAKRHIEQFLTGETYDDESDICHMAHAVAEALMCLEIFLSRPDADTRFYKTPPEYTGMRIDEEMYELDATSPVDISDPTFRYESSSSVFVKTKLQPSPLTKEELDTLNEFK